jgi:hypothetical protein
MQPHVRGPRADHGCALLGVENGHQGCVGQNLDRRQEPDQVCAAGAKHLVDYREADHLLLHQCLHECETTVKPARAFCYLFSVTSYNITFLEYAENICQCGHMWLA